MIEKVIADNEVRAVRKILWPDESVELTIKQRRLRPGGSLLTPTTFVVTNRRLIIVERSRYGIRKNYEVIPHKNITGVRLDHGIFSSSVFVRIPGYSAEEGKFKSGLEEGEIDGLRYKDAVVLADLLNEKVTERERKEEAKDIAIMERHMDSRPGMYVYCNNCGRKDNAGDTFCKYCGARLGHITVR